MALSDIPLLDIAGALVIAVIGGVVSRYIHPYVVILVDFIRNKSTDVPQWQKRLFVGIIIGVLIAYLPQAISIALENLERVGFRPADTISTEVMLGFAVIAVVSFQFRQTTTVRSTLLRVENKIESIESSINSIETIQTSENGPTDEVETDGGQIKPPTDERNNGGETSGSGMVGGAIAGGLMGAAGGPAGAVLGAVIGGALGDAIEQASVENQKRKQIKADIVRKMLQQHAIHPNKTRVDSFINQFHQEEVQTVQYLIHEMAVDTNAPIQYASQDQNYIQITTQHAAREYISRISS